VREFARASRLKEERVQHEQGDDLTVARRVGGVGGHVIEDRHVLFSARPRGVEREVALDPYFFLVFSVADAK